MPLELDHIFLGVRSPANGRERLRALGLTPTYARAHPGQGTANVCFAFDNAFVELLYVTDLDEALAPGVARIALARRCGAAAPPANPFGIAWRTTEENGPAELPLETWGYRPPYVPPGAAIAVASASDDAAQPLLFTFPGTAAPRSWPAERRGALQRSSGFARVDVRYHTAQGESVDAVRQLAQAGVLELGKPGDAPRVVLRLTGAAREPLEVELPSFAARIPEFTA